MTPDAREQIKADCERDEAKARQECFFDMNPGTILVENTWLCETHGRCATCERSLAGCTPVYCVCADYGASVDEERAWCSEGCLDAMHPEPSDQEPLKDEG